MDTYNLSYFAPVVIKCPGVSEEHTFSVFRVTELAKIDAEGIKRKKRCWLCAAAWLRECGGERGQGYPEPLEVGFLSHAEDLGSTFLRNVGIW